MWLQTGDSVTFKLNGHAYEVQLGPVIAVGERASLYEISSTSPTLKTLCVKVYQAPPPAARLTKLRAMIKLPTAAALRAQGISWPVSIASAVIEGEARGVGYLAPRAYGLPLTALTHRATRRERLAHWDRLSLCALLKAWLTQVRHLNDAGVYVSCRGEDLLLDATDPSKLALISTDNAQIGAHLGAPPELSLLPPELRPKRKGAAPRLTLDDAQQRLLIAAHLLSLLAPGASPYPFTYPLELDPALDPALNPVVNPAALEEVTEEGARALRSWALLTPELRALFHTCFVTATPPSVTEWFTALGVYEAALREGRAPLQIDYDDQRVEVVYRGDDERKRGSGEALNEVSQEMGEGRVGILELSTRAVKAMVADVARLWGGFEWGEPAFNNRAELTHTGQLVDAQQRIHLIEFGQRVLPKIEQLRDFLLSEGVCRFYVIATAVYRSAANRDDVMALLKDRLGLNVHILDRDQEARATFEGYRWLHPRLETDLLLIDQGGGSTEVAYFSTEGEMLERGHIPLGTESLLSVLMSSERVAQSGAEEILELIKSAPQQMSAQVHAGVRRLSALTQARARPFQIIALGSAITEATGESGNRRQHNKRLTRADLAGFIARCEEQVRRARLSADQLQRYIKSSAAQRDNLHEQLIYMIGVMMFEELLEGLNAESLTVSGVGLRYGYLSVALRERFERDHGRAFGEGEPPASMRPLEEFEGFRVGQQVRGIVTSVDFKLGVWLEISDNRQALLRSSQLRGNPYKISLDDFKRNRLVNLEVDSFERNYKDGEMEILLRLPTPKR